MAWQIYEQALKNTKGKQIVPAPKKKARTGGKPQLPLLEQAQLLGKPITFTNADTAVTQFQPDVPLIIRVPKRNMMFDPTCNLHIEIAANITKIFVEHVLTFWVWSGAKEYKSYQILKIKC